MQISLSGVHVAGRRGPMLDLGSLAVSTSECVLVAGEPGQGHTALSLVSTGRLAPYTGTVELRDDDGEPLVMEQLRRATAVVDLPGVSEPDDALTVGTVVAEDLALAGRPSSGRAAKRWLAGHDLQEHAAVRFDDLYGPLRTGVLALLAAERRHVRFVVLCLPDRHGGEPADWWRVALRLGSLGYGVLVQCGRSAARDLGAALPPTRGPASAPVEALRFSPAADLSGGADKEIDS